MKPLCVIPARMGSQRLKRKNVLPLAGVPMIVHTIKAALSSGIFERVIVSTEDDTIGDIARRHGATAHPRPPALAGDLVSATDVCLEVYEARKSAGEEAGSLVCLQPTSPLRTGDDVARAYERFVEAGADFLVSVTPIDPHYFHWALQQNGSWWEMSFGSKYLLERPLLPPRYRPNGAIKIGRIDPLLNLRNFFGPKLAAYEMPEERSIHVATQTDLAFAEYLLLHSGRTS